jgi:hypothetical protein
MTTEMSERQCDYCHHWYDPAEEGDEIFCDEQCRAADQAEHDDAVQIHTDEAGIYRDLDGNEYVAVEVDGELTFEPVVSTVVRSTWASAETKED